MWEKFKDGVSDDDNYMNELLGSKVIYRHYATLYFVFLVDQSESELGILDLIQVFVETLDRQFENVCELDLIFQVDKVHHILDEMVMGGMVLETNMHEVLTHVEEQAKLLRSESSSFLQAVTSSKAAGRVKALGNRMAP